MMTWGEMDTGEKSMAAMAATLSWLLMSMLELKVSKSHSVAVSLATADPIMAHGLRQSRPDLCYSLINYVIVG